MINVAMDVHVRNSFIKARDPDGHVLTQGRAGNNLLELSEKLAPVERAARAEAGEARQKVRVVMEATTNSRAVASLLARWGREAGIDLTTDVLDARRLRVIAESVNKCDRLDTDVLLDLACSGLKLRTCHVPDDEVFALREHLRARSDLVRVQTMLKNRVHALLHRRGILRPERMDVFGGRGREFLAQAPLEEAGRKTLDAYLSALDRLAELLSQSQRELRLLSKSERWRKPTELLRTIPGVGLITSLTLLAELGDLGRFRSRRSVSNYVGLVPSVRGSNDKMVHGGLVRHGNRHLRGVLIESAWRACEQVPVYASLFQRVGGRGGKQVAIVAVARRLLENAWTMLRKGEPFEYIATTDARIIGSQEEKMPSGKGMNDADV